MWLLHLASSHNSKCRIYNFFFSHLQGSVLKQQIATKWITKNNERIKKQKKGKKKKKKELKKKKKEKRKKKEVKQEEIP